MVRRLIFSLSSKNHQKTVMVSMFSFSPSYMPSSSLWKRCWIKHHTSRADDFHPMEFITEGLCRENKWTFATFNTCLTVMHICFDARRTTLNERQILSLFDEQLYWPSKNSSFKVIVWLWLASNLMKENHCSEWKLISCGSNEKKCKMFRTRWPKSIRNARDDK